MAATVNQTLTGACARALVQSARSGRAGTRQQLRAAARRFVRRHRRDAGALRFALRSARTSSALALALLGLGAAPAGAAVLQYTPLTGAANPLDAFDLGVGAKPAAGDLDGDGDLDLVAGTFNGSLTFFENTGSATDPAFVARTGSANPLAGEDVGYYSKPALGDLDADGDPDLVPGTREGTFAVHYLPEPGQGLLLGAAIALLGWLRRPRGRRER